MPPSLHHSDFPWNPDGGFEVDAGSGSRCRKRKLGNHRNRGVTGIASSRSDYMGVRNRGFTVEIKKWFEGLDFYKDVKMSEKEAALVHDLARLYVDITWDRLNIQALESRMQEEDPALAKFNWTLQIGKEFLIGFVEMHPLMEVAGNSKERADSMKDDIIALAPVAYECLKEKITREHSIRAVRQKKEVDDVSSFAQLKRENEDLKATVSAQDAEIASLKGALNAAHEKGRYMETELYAAKQAARAARMTPCEPAGVAERERFPQNESNPASETWKDYIDWSTNT
ncbi:hypothetical protein M758_2G224400 [Ceratodon purpureus]|nr:hypothetical protein M758_2G224400 [Ceratodon purpureus]